MFSDNARTYMELSGTALALTLTFSRQILHPPECENVANIGMVANVVVLSGRHCRRRLYRYLAVKYLRDSLTGVLIAVQLG